MRQHIKRVRRHAVNIWTGREMQVKRVVVSRDGHRALLVDHVDEDLYQLPNRDTFCHDLTLRSEARGKRWVAQLCASGLALTMQQDGGLGWGGLGGPALRDYAELAVGEYLDMSPLPTPDGDDRYGFRVNLSDAIAAVAEREPTGDEETLRYLAAKIYWGWRFRLPRTAFLRVDAVRLGIPAEDFDHIATQGLDIYWRRVALGVFEPLPTLLNEFRTGALPGLERPSLVQVEAVIDTGRFPGAKAHLEKAERFLFGTDQDFANAVKEAVLALESVAQIVTTAPGTTLGKCIKQLVNERRVSAESGRILEKLYAYRSAVPGVAHAGAEAPSVNEAEARFLMDAAAGAIRFLMAIPAGGSHNA